MKLLRTALCLLGIHTGPWAWGQDFFDKKATWSICSSCGRRFDGIR